jgi:hypothetical protein
MFRALKHAYSPLYERNEYMHKLKDAELKGLIIEETGLGDESNVPALILTSINTLKKHADFTVAEVVPVMTVDPPRQEERVTRQISAAQSNAREEASKVGLSLSYTINLNLPATSDIAVFNAIFKSLKENLLRGDDE